MSEYVIAKYIRLSLDDTQTDSVSIDTQRRVLDAHIAELDIPNAKVMEFVDNGFSGTNFERPGVQELLDLVRNGKINCIAVKDFSRFGRNAIEMGYFIERVFPLYRIRFISVSDDFDSADYDGDTGGMEVAFKFLIHEYYSRDLSKKIKAAKLQKQLSGEAVYKNCLFGYKLNDERKMVIDEPAADTVRLIFSLALENKSLADIARRLYEERRPMPREYKNKVENPTCTWNLVTIGEILKEEQYTGMYIAGRIKSADVGSKTQIKQKESDWIKIPDHHPAIVDKSVFVRVREIISGKAPTKTKRKMGTAERYRNIDKTLNGKVICGCCGHAMRLSSTTNSRYHCNYTRVAADAECYRLSVPAIELRDMLFEIISKQAQVILNIDYLSQLSELDLRIERQNDTQKQIERHNDDKRRLYERLIISEITADEYKAQKAIIETEINRLTRSQTALVTDTTMVTETRAGIERNRKIAEVVSGEIKLTQTIVDLLIDKVLIYPDNRIEIQWKA